MQLTKQKDSMFFTSGLFVRKQLARLVVACIFACYALSAFCITMTALLTDPEAATLRSCYRHGITEVSVHEITIWRGDWKHGYSCYRETFSEQQIRALIEYAGDSLEIVQPNDHVDYAEIKLSGDWNKDRKFIRKMRHRGEYSNKRIGFEVNTDFAPRISFRDTHTGVYFEFWQVYMLVISIVISLIIAAVIFAKRRRLLYDYPCNENGLSPPPRKLFYLQALFLFGVIFVAAALFAYTGVFIMNSMPHIFKYYTFLSDEFYTPFIVPEPISAVSTLALGALLMLPSAAPGKRFYKTCAADCAKEK